MERVNGHGLCGTGQAVDRGPPGGGAGVQGWVSVSPRGLGFLGFALICLQGHTRVLRLVMRHASTVRWRYGGGSQPDSKLCNKQCKSSIDAHTHALCIHNTHLYGQGCSTEGALARFERRTGGPAASLCRVHGDNEHTAAQRERERERES